MKRKTFDYANNYIEGKISEIIGIKTEKMAYDEDGSRYYYWYDKNNYKVIDVERDKIKSLVGKIEGKNIMIGLIQHDNDCMLIVGINS